MTFPDYDAIKDWFDLKLWTPTMVAKAVDLEHITSDDYKTITGEDYVAPVTK